MAENAIAQLEKAGHLFGGDIDDIRQSLHAAKYKGRGDKAERIIRARRKFYSEGDPQYQIGIEILVSDLQKEPSPQKRRQVLVKEVFGFSWKTASHFLRGVNLSENQLAILDVRVLGELLNFPELGLRASGLVRFDAKTNPKHPRPWDVLTPGVRRFRVERTLHYILEIWSQLKNRLGLGCLRPESN